MNFDSSYTNPICQADSLSYSQLYKTCFKQMYNYGRKFTADTGLIEDSIQEVFLDVWNKKGKLLEAESVNGYMFASFRYTLLKKIKTARRTFGADAFGEDPAFHIEQKIIADESDKAIQQKIDSALRTLTPRQREGIFLRFYQGLSYEEVAAILNITVKATYKIMARGLLNLKDQLAYPVNMLLFALVNSFDTIPQTF